jgi:hypothetical protein
MVNSGKTSAVEAALLLGVMIAGILVEPVKRVSARRHFLSISRKASSAGRSPMLLHRKSFTLSTAEMAYFSGYCPHYRRTLGYF